MILNWFQPVPRIHDLDPFSGVTKVVPLRASAGGFPPLKTSVMGHFVLRGTQTMILNWFQPVPRKHDLDPFSGVTIKALGATPTYQIPADGQFES